MKKVQRAFQSSRLRRKTKSDSSSSSKDETINSPDFALYLSGGSQKKSALKSPSNSSMTRKSVRFATEAESESAVEVTDVEVAKKQPNKSALETAQEETGRNSRRPNCKWGFENGRETMIRLNPEADVTPTTATFMGGTNPRQEILKRITENYVEVNQTDGTEVQTIRNVVEYTQIYDNMPIASGAVFCDQIDDEPEANVEIAEKSSKRVIYGTQENVNERDVENITLVYGNEIQGSPATHDLGVYVTLGNVIGRGVENNTLVHGNAIEGNHATLELEADGSRKNVAKREVENINLVHGIEGNSTPDLEAQKVDPRTSSKRRKSGSNVENPCTRITRSSAEKLEEKKHTVADSAGGTVADSCDAAVTNKRKASGADTRAMITRRNTSKMAKTLPGASENSTKRDAESGKKMPAKKCSVRKENTACKSGVKGVAKKEKSSSKIPKKSMKRNGKKSEKSAVESGIETVGMNPRVILTRIVFPTCAPRENDEPNE